MEIEKFLALLDIILTNIRKNLQNYDLYLQKYKSFDERDRTM